MPDDPRQRVWIRRSGRAIDIRHGHVVIDGLNVDGLWHGNAQIDADGRFVDPSRNDQWVSGTNGIIRIVQDARHVTLRNGEVRNNQRHLIRVHGSHVLLENMRIHHAIARVNGSATPQVGRVTGDEYFNDAHGIVASHAFGLSVRRTHIGQVSGDCVQLERSPWGEFLVENSLLEIAPLEQPVLDLAADVWFGEDLFDTKTPDRGRNGAAFNAGVTFRGNVLRGTRYSRIQHGAVLNLKEGVENILLEGNRIHDNRMALRLREPTRGYAIRKNLFYDNAREHFAVFEILDQHH